jgi:hypothetical protein
MNLNSRFERKIKAYKKKTVIYEMKKSALKYENIVENSSFTFFL